LILDYPENLNGILKHSFMKSKHFSIIPPSQYKRSPLESLDLFKKIYDKTLKDRSFSNLKKLDKIKKVKGKKSSNDPILIKNTGIFFNKRNKFDFLPIAENFQKNFQKKKNNLDFKIQMLKLNKLKNKPTQKNNRKLSKRSFNSFSKNNFKKNINLMNLKKKNKNYSKSKGKTTNDITNTNLDNNLMKSFFKKFDKKVKKSTLMEFYRPRLSERDLSHSSALRTINTFFDDSEESDDMIKTLKKIKAFDSINVTDSMFRKNIRELYLKLGIEDESNQANILSASLEVGKNKRRTNQNEILNKNNSN
jgi:hypothetical protein